MHNSIVLFQCHVAQCLASWGHGPLALPFGSGQKPARPKARRSKARRTEARQEGSKARHRERSKTRHGKSEGFKVMIDVGTGTVGLDVQRNVLLLGVSDVARRRMTRYVPATYVKSKCEYGYTIQRTQRVEQVCHSGRAYIHAYGQVWINCRG